MRLVLQFITSHQQKIIVICKSVVLYLLYILKEPLYDIY